jgi:ParB family chromosome partitioning protein
MTDTNQTEAVSGVEIFVPLNKLKKSPKNARKVAHGDAAIEALAASIQHKRMIQNLVVEPETNEDGTPTGFYLVTAGEGRRLAQLLRAKRKQIKKTELIRCWLDTENDPAEISLDENVTRTNMHPADQFERFHELSETKGWGAEEIGARFGVSAQVVKQRLRLGAVSPKLIQVYREDGVTLDQLMAFAITTDHIRQEQVFENLSYNKEPWIIRRDLTANNVPAHDRRAVFIGPEAYSEAGGGVIRDLFTEDRGGYFDDAGLLDMLTVEKLRELAAEVLAEGWKWAEASIDFPHAHGMRRYYPERIALSDEDEARLETASSEYDALTEGYSSTDELPEGVAEKLEALDAEIDEITAKRSAYDPDVIARGGVFVVLNQDGMPRIERGFVRPEDAKAAEPEVDDTENGIGGEDGDGEQADDELAEDEVEEPEVDDGKPIPDSLIRDLTAHRTLGLRLALGEQTDVAMVALTHALVSQIFYKSDAYCLEIRVSSEELGGHAEGIADTKTGEVLADRHDRWGEQLPRDVADLWAFIVALDGDSRSVLLAHCVAMSVNAVKLPWERKTRALAAADVLVQDVSLDMTAHWTPTVRSYFGRVTKAHIAKAVGEAVSPEAAARISPMKKPDMAEAAEQLVVAVGWLPAILRAPERIDPVEMGDTETVEQPSEAQAPDTEAEDGDAHAYAVAAE